MNWLWHILGGDRSGADKPGSARCMFSVVGLEGSAGLVGSAGLFFWKGAGP